VLLAIIVKKNSLSRQLYLTTPKHCTTYHKQKNKNKTDKRKVSELLEMKTVVSML